MNKNEKPFLDHDFECLGIIGLPQFDEELPAEKKIRIVDEREEKKLSAIQAFNQQIAIAGRRTGKSLSTMEWFEEFIDKVKEDFGFYQKAYFDIETETFNIQGTNQIILTTPNGNGESWVEDECNKAKDFERDFFCIWTDSGLSEQNKKRGWSPQINMGLKPLNVKSLACNSFGNTDSSTEFQLSEFSDSVGPGATPSSIRHTGVWPTAVSKSQSFNRGEATSMGGLIAPMALRTTHRSPEAKRSALSDLIVKGLLHLDDVSYLDAESFHLCGSKNLEPHTTPMNQTQPQSPKGNKMRITNTQLDAIASMSGAPISRPTDDLSKYLVASSNPKLQEILARRKEAAELAGLEIAADALIALEHAANHSTESYVRSLRAHRQAISTLEYCLTRQVTAKFLAATKNDTLTMLYINSENSRLITEAQQQWCETQLKENEEAAKAWFKTKDIKPALENKAVPAKKTSNRKSA
jgi:hypothetical protein